MSRTGRASIDARFWAKVYGIDGCWLWTGSRNIQGHGRFWITGERSGRMAHRMAYEWIVGPIPEGLEIDHLCRVPHCVNPAHMEPVTSRENTLRGNGPAGIAARKTHCSQGHPLSGDNLRLAQGRRPGILWRRCRACGG